MRWRGELAHEASVVNVVRSVGGNVERNEGGGERGTEGYLGVDSEFERE